MEIKIAELSRFYDSFWVQNFHCIIYRVIRGTVFDIFLLESVVRGILVNFSGEKNKLSCYITVGYNLLKLNVLLSVTILADLTV